MKNKKLWIIICSLILIIASLLFYSKVQSAFPKYLRINSNSKLITIPINHLFTGSKNLEKPKKSVYFDNNYANCIDQKTGTVTCASYCPVTDGQYCPPEDGYIVAYNEEGKNYKDIIVTNHSYFFDYALSRIFSFGQYRESGVVTSNTGEFKAPRVITFLHPDNVKKSDKVSWCNGAIKIERALLGYAKSKNSDGSIKIDKNIPAVYLYISRYVYPVDKDAKVQKCINFGLAMDVVEPNLEAAKTYLPANFDNSKIRYYFLDIQEYPN